MTVWSLAWRDGITHFRVTSPGPRARPVSDLHMLQSVQLGPAFALIL